MTGGEICLCVHGHFYQPPRENPWLEAIEEQPSAAPFHNWNERIQQECYLPQAVARILNEKGQIVDMVNNFEGMSFNFGPTLLAWIQEKHPRTYELIREADKISVQTHHGHGNAIAQAYNHMILPLSSRRDKVTQVRWGVADFRHRFGRDPESLWLPETACNTETLEVLIEEGMRYVILEPHQAKAVRPIDAKGWQDVSDGSIDPRQPYRWFYKGDKARFIDIFFYDGPVSKAIGFEDILESSQRLAARLVSTKVDTGRRAQLIHVATDGETYGHHKPFGDRVLAYLLAVEAPKQGFRIVNYGEYLAEHPPRMAVRLKEGENGEGTSWSCAHGVRRWRTHCGCRGDGPAGWRQDWREPLRNALDWLRGKLSEAFEQHGGAMLKDVWAARDAYIRVLLDRGDSVTEDFLREHASERLDAPDRLKVIKLLEMQRNAMLMYTSCGWFFTELSGIETVQVLHYAARAVELVREVAGWELEAEFLAKLQEAKSNVPALRDGKKIYEQLVRPHRAGHETIAALYAINRTAHGATAEAHEKEHVLYSFRVHARHCRVEAYGTSRLAFGRVAVRSRITGEEKDLVFCVYQLGVYEFRCSMKEASERDDWDAVEGDLFAGLHALHTVDLMRKIDAAFGEGFYALQDLPLEDRKAILTVLTRDTVDQISVTNEQLYDANRRLAEMFQTLRLKIPEEIRSAAQHTLNRRLTKELVQVARAGYNPRQTRQVTRVFEAAEACDVRLHTQEAVSYLEADLRVRIRGLAKACTAEALEGSVRLLKGAKKWGLDLDLRLAQDRMIMLLQKPDPTLREAVEGDEQIAKRVVALAEALWIHPGMVQTARQRWGQEVSHG